MSGNMQHGAKVGTRIAMLVSQAIISTHMKLAATKHKLVMSLFHLMSDEISTEAQHVLGPTWEKLLADPNLHPDIKPHIEFLAHTKGQMSALSGTQLASGSIVGALAIVINNALEPAVAALLAADPNQIPDPGTLATMLSKSDVIPHGDKMGFLLQGYNDLIADKWIDTARQYPSIADGLDMLRRGIITDAQFDLLRQRNGMPEQFASAWRQMKTIPISIADAALAVLRGNMTLAEGERIAVEWGYTAQSFGVLVGNTGEPPGLMQLLEGYRREFIDKATLEKGILQSRYRNEWIPLLEQLRYSPMTVSDAVRAVVQGQLSEAQGQKYAAENGLDPSQFPIMVATDGNPLSRTEMMSLYHRGLATKAQVDQASTESRLKNKYTQLAFELGTTLLEARQLGTMVTNGVITQQEAIAKAMQRGYSQADATILIAEATAAKVKTYTNREMAAVELLYENNAISMSDLQAMATQLGYNADEITAIGNAAEFRREEKSLATAISAGKTKFIGHHLTTEEASAYLASAGVPTAQAQTLLELWTVERSANVRTLTEAQVIHAMKKSIITPDEADTRLIDMGYSAADAAILIGGA